MTAVILFGELQIICSHPNRQKHLMAHFRVKPSTKLFGKQPKIGISKIAEKLLYIFETNFSQLIIK